jgi:hypothetical protein
MKEFKIKITYKEGNSEIIEIRSSDIEWSMEQYKRNREPFDWKIKEEKEFK